MSMVTGGIVGCTINPQIQRGTTTGGIFDEWLN